MLSALVHAHSMFKKHPFWCCFTQRFVLPPTKHGTDFNGFAFLAAPKWMWHVGGSKGLEAVHHGRRHAPNSCRGEAGRRSDIESSGERQQRRGGRRGATCTACDLGPFVLLLRGYALVTSLYFLFRPRLYHTG